MGFGGFHIHFRTGLATEYLGDEFMGLATDKGHTLFLPASPALQ